MIQVDLPAEQIFDMVVTETNYSCWADLHD